MKGTKDILLACDYGIVRCGFLSLYYHNQPKATAAEHLQDCFGFIPGKSIWRLLCSDEVELAVAVLIVVALFAGLHLTILER